MDKNFFVTKDLTEETPFQDDYFVCQAILQVLYQCILILLYKVVSFFVYTR